jgi:hypothetical protein
MVTEHFTDNQCASIQRAFGDKTGDELSFSVEIVDNIPLTTRGKLRRLESRLAGHGYHVYGSSMAVSR